MKVAMSKPEAASVPMKGTIIEFGDYGLAVTGIYVGRSNDNEYMVVVLQHKAISPGTLCTFKELSGWSRFKGTVTLSND